MTNLQRLHRDGLVAERNFLSDNSLNKDLDATSNLRSISNLAFSHRHIAQSSWDDTKNKEA